MIKLKCTRRTFKYFWLYNNNFKGDNFIFDDFQWNADNYIKQSYSHYKEKRKNKEKNRNKDLKELFVEYLDTYHGITIIIDVKMFQSFVWVIKENIEGKSDYNSLI